MSSNNNMISLTSVSNLRLEQFRTQHELARNFYDDHEFCPVYLIEEVTEHRERIQKRTSPYPSPTYSPPPSYYVPSKQQTPPSFSHRQHSHNHNQHATSTAATTAASATRAIPIIDPSNMTPVSVPMQQQYPQKTNTTSPSMAQWIAYKNSAVSKTSPTISNSNISSMSSSSSGSSNQSHNSSNNYNYYYSNNNCAINYTQVNYQPQQPMVPVVARAIPIIDPATRQVFRQQQTSTNIPPGFYNVSVC